MASLDPLGSTLQGWKVWLIYFRFYWVDREGGGGVELKSEILNTEMREHEWTWSRRNRSCANIWSKFSVQLPWTTISPPVKGDYHVWSGTGWIHGAVLCRIVNWKGLNAYSVISPLNIWTTFGVWLLRTLGGPPSTGENCVILNNIYLLFYWVEGSGACVCVGRGVRWNCYCEMWIINILQCTIRPE